MDCFAIAAMSDEPCDAASGKTCSVALDRFHVNSIGLRFEESNRRYVDPRS